MLYKDLNTISGDLTKVIMIDDSEVTYNYNPRKQHHLNTVVNTYKIKHWTKANKDDTALKNCLSLIQYMSYSDNIQTELANVLQMTEEWMPSNLWAFLNPIIS